MGNRRALNGPVIGQPGGTTMRRLLEIRSGRHPFQVLVVSACPLAAVAVLATGRFPPSLVAALPHPFADLWLALLATSGVITLLGTYWRGDLDNGLLIEGGGMTMLAAMLNIYVAALFVVSGSAAVAAGAFLGALGAAGWWRAWQIGVDVRKVWRAQRDGLTANVRVLIEPPERPAPGTGAP
jgi:hypothetical protein